MSLSGQQHDATAAKADGLIFEENCAACRGGDGRGGYEIGAPDWGDESWIYGATGMTSITASILVSYIGFKTWHLSMVFEVWEGQVVEGAVLGAAN